ncbi:VOC family protein [Burkholderia alba]|uniref:VOC family protein n=1 Tax=Burkholderia alba TaxID=2683677 RepID=UPI002B0623CB|nr:VOC family protein [Burkholderia alba]
MPVTGFSHYNLRAPRELLDTLCAFYRDIVGLRVGPRPPFSSFGYWLYADTHDILHLTETAPGEIRAVHTATTFDHVAFACTGLADVESALAARAVRYDRSQVPATGQVQLFFSDPAGNGVELNFVP